MLNLPKSTEYGKRIPKESFYQHLAISPKVKNAFVDEIKTIIWQNKLAPNTINIPKGPAVEEIQVFAINLKKADLSEDVLRVIDSQIPYFIVYVLCYSDKYKLCAGYKEGIKTGKYSVKAYYHTDWLDKEQANLVIKGLNLDEGYSDFILQIGKGVLLTAKEPENIADVINKTELVKRLEVELEALTKKQYREEQPKKQYEIHQKILELASKLEVIRNGKA